MLRLRSLPIATVVSIALAACGDDGDLAGTGGASGTTSTSTSAATSTSTATTTATSTGTGSSTTGEGGTATCGPSIDPTSSEACDACVAEQCCAEAAACRADAECDAFARCVAGCGADGDCLVACAATQPIAAAQALGFCEGELCHHECGLDELVCDSFVSPDAPEPDACRECLDETCCDVFQDSQTIDYYAFARCTTGCLDAQCLRDCELDHPGGAAGTDATNACFLDGCGDLCVPPDHCGAFYFTGPPPCAECSVAECCDLHEECSHSVECLDFFACQINCSDAESCRTCLELWSPETAALGWGMNACTQIECDACNGNTCGTVPGLDGGTCQSCMEDACCETSAACARDLACLTLEICVDLCEGDADCEDGCRDDYPDGEALFDPLVACRVESCVDDCP